MAKAKRAKQLNIMMTDKVGVLSEICTSIANAKVNINTLCAYGMDGKANFMIITNSNAKAKRALSWMGAEISEEDVVTVELPNKVGALRQVAKKIADAGINIFYLYATEGTGKTSTCVFKSSDDRKAIKVLNK